MPRPFNPIQRINSLYDQCLIILEREVYHLSQLSIATKLETSPAKDLRETIKLLGGLKDAHASIMKDKQEAKAAKAKQVDEATLTEAVLKGK
jgi:flagellin-specific chaperone FliS